jgi:hypothetical protein
MSNEEEGSQTGKRTWDNLCSTLVELGQPALISPPSKEPLARHLLFIEFMRMHEHRPVDSVRDLFVVLNTPSVGQINWAQITINQTITEL